MKDLVGRSLGRYQITALVGRGGMATVYKARHPGLDRVVAVKVLHPNLAIDPAFVGRFRREARAVAALRHPNIVRVFDFDSQDSIYFIVMEFIDGPTLASLLKRRFKKNQPLSPQETLRLFSPLCSAIQYAHEQGMVHRDIKPSNIILTRQHEPILTDFGIAKIVGATSYTIPGVVVGSAHYMSPEQAEGLPGDHRSDIYSLGIVLFETLTGTVPFQGETPASILMKHVASPLPSARSLNPDLPPAIDAILDRTLAKDPNSRFQQGNELVLALQEALGLAEQAAAAGAGGIEAPTVKIPREAPTPPPLEEPTRVAEPTAVTEPSLPIPPGVLRRRAKAKLPMQALVGGIVLVGIIAAVVGFLVLGGSGGSSQPPASATALTATAERALALIAEGDSLVQAGKLQDALTKYQEALQSDPNNDVARTQLGIVYFLLAGMEDMAEQQLEMALQTNPSNVKALSFLCITRSDLAHSRRTNDFGPAEEACRKALEIEPENPEALAFLGEVYAAQGRKDEGLTETQRAVGLAPKNPYVLASVGYVHALRDEWSAAVPYYQQAVTVQPNFAYLHLLLAEALRHTQQWDEALSYARIALDLGQGYDARAYTSMGHTMWQRGDSDGAITNFQQAVALDNTEDYAYWGWGALLYERDDYQGALPHLERAAALVPNSAGYQTWVGACYMALERYQEARTALERALQLDPEREDARDLLDELTAMGY
ncbi:MAG: protein kinase domain-containing protein [Dehalococcoidia bacterium]